LVLEVGSETFSAMLIPREGVDSAKREPHRILLRKGSPCLPP